MKKKIIRVTTVPVSLSILLKGQLNFMNDYYEMIGISSDKETLEKVGLQENIRVIPVEMTRAITPFKDLKAVYLLYKIFKQEQPFIVHSHTPKAGTVSMLAAVLAGVPNRLHTIAGLPLVEATGVKRRLLNLVEKITYACATKVYPNSKGLQDIVLENRFTKPEKLKIIGHGSSNGIDTAYFSPEVIADAQKNELKTALNILATDTVFVFVGRLVKDKGINELIEAYKAICNEYDNTKLLLVGSYEKDLDPLLPETEHEINSNTNIIPVGWQTDVRPYLAISNVLVFPSYREGFPNVVMQAGAMGLYSIVSNINGCNEIVVEAKNGTIVPVKDANALYDKMKAFLNKKLSVHPETNRELITSRYERSVIWKELLAEYKLLEAKNQENS